MQRNWTVILNGKQFSYGNGNTNNNGVDYDCGQETFAARKDNTHPSLYSNIIHTHNYDISGITDTINIDASTF